MGKRLSSSHSASTHGAVAQRPRASLRVLAWRALGLSVFGLTALASCGGGLGDESYVEPERPVLNAVDLNNRPYCVGSCLPDYGSQRIDCNADIGLEFFPVDVLNGDSGTIDEFYAYNDDSSRFMWAGPERFNPNANPETYAPDAAIVNDRCEPGDRVHHLRGGLFREWGGGMGRRMINMAPSCGPAGTEGNPAFCPDPNPRFEEALMTLAATPPDPEGPPRVFDPQVLRQQYYGMQLDLREWEGISFWARSGPNNTAGIRVYVADAQLDEDIAFLEQHAGLQPTCRRERECACRNHRPCTPYDGTDAPHAGKSFCYDPEIDGSLAAIWAELSDPTVGWTENGFEALFERCGDSRCEDGNPAFQTPDPLTGVNADVADPAFHPRYGNQCLPQKLTNDFESLYCYNPNDPVYPKSPDGPERCGDGWATGVALTGDWQFFKIPFTELRQEGWGKEFQYLDLSRITLVRFTWMQGWVDVWLDDVRFYRKPLPAAPSAE